VIAAADVYRDAVRAWQARTPPAYVSFSLPCADTAFAGACDPTDDARFTVRMADGRTYAVSVPKGTGEPKVLLRGGFIYGPGGAPLGFYRRLGDATATPPPNLAPDPLQLPTIASVTAIPISYDLTLAGNETVDGIACYHLALRALRDPDVYPLHDLWVDERSFEVRALTYDWDFGDGHRGLVHYRFAQVGVRSTWAIVQIDATVAERHEFLKTRTDSVNDDLYDVEFPESEPSDEFTVPAVPSASPPA
jgi:hypothetical protein